MLLECVLAAFLASVAVQERAVQAGAVAAPAQEAQLVVPRFEFRSGESERAFARAAKENRRVLVVLKGADAAQEAHTLLNVALATGKVRTKLSYEYDLLTVDAASYARQEAERRKNGGGDGFVLDPTAPLPRLAVVDADHKLLAETGIEAWWTTDKSGARRLDEAKLLAHLTSHQAPYLEAAKVRDAALARAQAEGKLVFLHFGAPWCGWCHKLEGWMEREKVAPLLAREFIDLKIDTDRMTGGADMLKQLRTAAGLKEQGGIPWFVFLDADGRVLATSEGPKGNTGFPYADDEVAHFVTMLTTSCKKLGAPEIERLREELAAVRREDEASKAAK